MRTSRDLPAAPPNPHARAARVGGALFLVATASYAAGNAMLEGALGGSGSGGVAPQAAITLMLVNSAAVVGIGAIFFPVLWRHEPSIAAAHLAARIVEALALTIGELGLLLSLDARSAAYGGAAPMALTGLALRWNHLAYQLAMTALGLGGLAFAFALARARLVPRALAAWGALGYTALLASALLGLWGGHVSLLWYLPGGTFELALPAWLFAKGFAAGPQQGPFDGGSKPDPSAGNEFDGQPKPDPSPGNEFDGRPKLDPSPGNEFVARSKPDPSTDNEFVARIEAEPFDRQRIRCPNRSRTLRPTTNSLPESKPNPSTDNEFVARIEAEPFCRERFRVNSEGSGFDFGTPEFQSQGSGFAGGTDPFPSEGSRFGRATDP